MDNETLKKNNNFTISDNSEHGQNNKENNNLNLISNFNEEINNANDEN